MIKVTFSNYSKILKRHFPNVETAIFKSLEDAKLRSMALNWTIEKVEQL